ncbi:MAG: prepilin-type N-terminal cleavage/methylation domain-containing protein, partial [Acidobacteriota bacterium]
MGVRDIRGFSLVEAIVVLALLLIVAAISIPLITGSTAFSKLRD